LFEFLVFASLFSSSSTIHHHPTPSNTIAAMSQSVRAQSVPADEIEVRFDAAIAKRKADFDEIFKTTPEAPAEVEDFAVWGRQFKAAWVSRDLVSR
jgi:hypothetical protein